MSPPAPPYRRSKPLGVRDGLLLAEAVLGLAIGALALSFLPFRQVIARAGHVRSARAQADVRRLRWAVDAAARRVPWGALCFARALALRAMLRRRGVASVLHYGIGRENAEALKAHVWLSVDGEVVIGGEAASRYACVGSFPENGGA